MTTLLAAPAGREPPRLAARAAEDRTLTLDCSPLLAEGEHVDAVITAHAAPGSLRLTSAPKLRPGNQVEMSLRAPPADALKTWRDHAVTLRLRTSRGQQLQAVLTVRVHRE